MSGAHYVRAGRTLYLARNTASLSSSAMSWRAGTTLGSTYRHRPGARAKDGIRLQFVSNHYQSLALV